MAKADLLVLDDCGLAPLTEVRSPATTCAKYSIAMASSPPWRQSPPGQALAYRLQGADARLAILDRPAKKLEASHH